ncbi:hypothetical protein GCM10027320_30140 [Massilia solisilvae]
MSTNIPHGPTYAWLPKRTVAGSLRWRKDNIFRHAFGAQKGQRERGPGQPSGAWMPSFWIW